MELSPHPSLAPLLAQLHVEGGPAAGGRIRVPTVSLAERIRTTPLGPCTLFRLDAVPEATLVQRMRDGRYWVVPLSFRDTREVVYLCDVVPLLEEIAS